MTALVTVLTLLSLGVVVLTRIRLWSVRSVWLALHTVFGALGAVIWLVFLAEPSSSRLGGSLVGVIGLGCWWIVSVAGIALIAIDRSGGGRRARGRAVATPTRVAWGVVHVLVLLAWLVNTWAYADRRV